MPATLIHRVEAWVFGHRALVLAAFAVATLALALAASQLKVAAGFEKQLPVEHPYMQTFLEYQEQFGGANRVLIAIEARRGDIFTPAFFNVLKKVTDEVFFLPGVDRARVTSLFTPNVRFIEIVEDGFAGGNVIPADFRPTREGLDQVRENILKSGQMGRLVSQDFRAAIVSANLLDRDPRTGERLDYMAVAKRLETEVRARYESEAFGVHVIGFAKVIGDVADGAAGVVGFFGVAVLLTALLVWSYAHSVVLSAMLVGCSLVAVVWQLGLLVMLGYGIDPMSLLLPFLIFAIAVSHGVQMVNGVGAEMYEGAGAMEAARSSFRKLLVPGVTALSTDVAGFLTIMLIEIPIIQELAVSASVGVAVIILTNLFLLPVLLSYAKLGERHRDRLRRSTAHRLRLWETMAAAARPAVAVPILVATVALGAWAWHEGRGMAVGDMEAGVPELWPDSRYNRDTAFIVERFAIGVDLIQVIAEVPANGCIRHDVVSYLDDFDWFMRNVPGVQSTLSLPTVMKTVNAGWNEGSPKWRVLPRDERVLVRAVTPVETSTGLLNADCSVMPVLIFTEDHKAETIRRVTEAVGAFAAANPSADVRLRLATGNVGVMAATNEAVDAAQMPMLLWVYGVVVALCLLTFRSVYATLCTVLPLTLVSLLCNALMAQLGIGLKVSTLPVAALGVGIGVDYGIYIFSRLQVHLQTGEPLPLAYLRTLRETGSAVIFTGITLAVGVSTWLFSALKFQADMGLLLTFMFLVNMVGAVLVLPALAAVLAPVFGAGRNRKGHAQE
ncbi:efflux RND transporter permease subunit [Arenibaculum pallidiluteum]|uniref:efflux RND transporter permease subunit n=1 Tax=Arenibaculum pallidiluteum TaxID=2812559 RepID=UPI001A96767E|nr:MMPL family transporter [Arenibaculum pallidiluteum]